MHKPHRHLPQLVAVFVSIAALCFSFIQRAKASAFEIDEIVTAIRNEIQTANSSKLGNPRFIIESVDVVLTVTSMETGKGALAIKILGLDGDTDAGFADSGTHHQLRYSF